MSGDRGDGDFGLGDVDSMVRLQIFIFVPPSSYQTSDTHFSNERALHYRTDGTIRHSSDSYAPHEPNGLLISEDEGSDSRLLRHKRCVFGRYHRGDHMVADNFSQVVLPANDANERE